MKWNTSKLLSVIKHRVQFIKPNKVNSLAGQKKDAGKRRPYIKEYDSQTGVVKLSKMGLGDVCRVN